MVRQSVLLLLALLPALTAAQGDWQVGRASYYGAWLLCSVSRLVNAASESRSLRPNSVMLSWRCRHGRVEHPQGQRESLQHCQQQQSC